MAAFHLRHVAPQTDYWLYSDITGAQTQVDTNRAKDWTITLAPTAAPLAFKGGQLMMKRGSSSSANVVLTPYSSTSSSGTQLAQATLPPTSFAASVALEVFQCASAVTLTAGNTYYDPLTSTAVDTQSQAYFIRTDLSRCLPSPP